MKNFNSNFIPQKFFSSISREKDIFAMQIKYLLAFVVPSFVLSFVLYVVWKNHKCDGNKLSSVECKPGESCVRLCCDEASPECVDLSLIDEKLESGYKVLKAKTCCEMFIDTDPWEFLAVSLFWSFCAFMLREFLIWMSIECLERNNSNQKWWQQFHSFTKLVLPEKGSGRDNFAILCWNCNVIRGSN